MSRALRSVLEPPKHVWNTPQALRAVERLQNCVNLQPVPKKMLKRKWVAAASAGASNAAAAVGMDAGTAEAGGLASAGAAPGGAASLLGGFGMGLGTLPDLASYNRAGGKDDASATKESEKDKKRGKHEKDKMTLDQLLLGQGVDEVGTVNPVADFRAMCARRDVDKVVDALLQIERVARKLIDESVGGHLYDKALECLAAMREVCIQQSETDHWNGVIATFRANFQGQLRHDFWMKIKGARLTLIHEEESPDSDVTRAEAEEFLKEVQPAQDVSVSHQMMDEDEENLFEQMD